MSALLQKSGLRRRGGRLAVLCTGVIVILLGGAVAWAAQPDLSGPWQYEAGHALLRTVNGDAPPLSASGAKALQQTQALYKANRGADPIEDCLPPGVPRVMLQPFPFNIVQGRRTILMLLEWNHLTRIIYMDRGHFPVPLGTAYLGQSVGRWDGGTLVVDTNNYNDTTWLDDAGLPHSGQLTTLERIRLVDGGQKLEDRITFTDPAMYARPWTARLLFVKRPGVIIREDYCLGRMGKGRSVVTQ